MKRAARYTLLFVVAIQTVGIIAGCTQHAQPKAWLSVEKKPMRVIYVDYHKDISPETTQMVIDRLTKIPFRETDMDPMTGIVVDYDADTHHSSQVHIKTEVD